LKNIKNYKLYAYVAKGIMNKYFLRSCQKNKKNPLLQNIFAKK